MKHVFSCSLITIPESLVTKDPASCQQSYVVCDSVNNRLPVSWYIPGILHFRKITMSQHKTQAFLAAPSSPKFGHLNWCGNKLRKS